MSQGARKLFHLLIKRLLNKSCGQVLHPYFNNIFISVLFYFRGRFSVTNQRFNRTINTVKKCKYIYYLWIWREIILWSVIYGAFTYGARNKSARKGRQKARFFFLGGGGNEQNEHRYRPLQLMAFAGPGWQSTCIKRSSSLISCGMLINLIFEDIQSAIVVWSRDTGVYSLRMYKLTCTQCMTQKNLTIFVECFSVFRWFTL